MESLGDIMKFIGENINLMSRTVSAALRSQDTHSIQMLAQEEASAGMDYININTGPAKRGSAGLMQWMVETVQAVTPLPLSLDTTSNESLEAGLRVYRSPHRALINSITLARLDEEISLLSRYPAEMVGLLWGPEGMPRDVNERCLIAVDLVYRANQAGIPNERVWLDPIMTPISVSPGQVKACLEFMSMVGEIAPGCKSIIGLSNVSSGAPHALRPYLNRTFAIMMGRYGLYSAIVDAFDVTLRQVVRGELPGITQVVYRIMDGEGIDTSLTAEEIKYAKTTRVLLGETLYSHAWLEA
jgi:5-methyltetrahydrofolate corrinoid/iron sulfur protein methyltransferase